jgi:hypothetical protein
VKTAPVRTDSLAGPLATIGQAPLHTISTDQVDKVLRRIVDNQALAPKLDVAAFNSAV